MTQFITHKKDLDKMENSNVRELSIAEIANVHGGRSSWESIGYQVGKAFGWFYNNVMIGTPWP